MFNDPARDLLLKIGSEVLLDELVLALGKAFEFNFSIGLILYDNFTVRFPRPWPFSGLGGTHLARFLISAVQYAALLDTHLIFNVD